MTTRFVDANEARAGSHVLRNNLGNFRFVLCLANSGCGKTTAAANLREQGVCVLDTDDCRWPILDEVLKPLRLAQTWHIHNAIWHPLIMGCLAGVYLGSQGRGPTVVFDHTGWFVADMQVWSHVAKIVVIRSKAAKDAQRFVSREVKARGKSRTVDEAQKMVSSMQRTREAFLGRAREHGLKSTVLDQHVLWATPQVLLGP